MSRDYTIGATDAATGVAADATAPNAGKVVKVPDYTDVMDGPKTFIEFANSMPAGGGGGGGPAIQVSQTEPGPGTAGDLWVDTGGFPYTLKTYFPLGWKTLAEPGLEHLATQNPTTNLIQPGNHFSPKFANYRVVITVTAAEALDLKMQMCTTNSYGGDIKTPVYSGFFHGRRTGAAIEKDSDKDVRMHIASVAPGHPTSIT